MTISIDKYVSITSAVGGGAQVPQRALVLRIFTTSVLVPGDSVLRMTSQDDAISYFGSGTEEAQRAVANFGFISKSATRPQEIQYVRFSDSDQPGLLVGGSIAGLQVSALKAVTNGLVKVTLGGVSVNLSALNFSTITTMSDAATIIQTALRAASAATPAIAQAVVAFDAPTQAFRITEGDTSAGMTDVADNTSGSGTQIATMLALSASTRKMASDATLQETPIESVERSRDANNNFLTFLFIGGLTPDEELPVAQYTQSLNIEIMYLPSYATSADCQAAFEALGTIGGVAATLSPIPGQFPEQIISSLAAATDFNRPAANKNYMYQQADGLAASVSDTPTSDLLDASRVNYYGVTETAGTNLAFFQRGVMFGGPLDPSDINIFVNEAWLKDKIRADLLNLELALEAIPANDTGRGYMLTTITSSIVAALANGVILTAKQLTVLQQTFITEQSGDPRAWNQVQQLGWWISVTIVAITGPDDKPAYEAQYLLIYSKGDTVRTVRGSHELI